jgi:hypothetical protein
MKETSHSVIIREAYKTSRPSFAAAQASRRLLGGIPPKYLVGLKTIVLTDATGLSHEKKRWKSWYRGRKVLIRESRGLYHHASQGTAAWIEIFLDNTTKHFPQSFLKIPIFADIVLGEVLFHEIGHHIHETQSPEFRERENVADQWKRRLSRLYFDRAYWYLIPIVYLFYPVIKLRQWWRRKRKSGQKNND